MPKNKFYSVFKYMIMIAKKRAFVKNQYAFSAFFRKRYCEICAFSRQIARISCRKFILQFRQNPAQW